MFMSESRKQLGFTLIELVMVIVILGILAATALPKLTNLSGAARYSKMQGLLGAMKSANAIVHSKAIVSGVENGTVMVGGEIISVTKSYAVVGDLLVAAGADSADFTLVRTFVDKLLVIQEKSCIIVYVSADYNAQIPVGSIYGIFNDYNNKTC